MLGNNIHISVDIRAFYAKKQNKIEKMIYTSLNPFFDFLSNNTLLFSL